MLEILELILLLYMLAAKNISLEEIVSTHNEMTLIVHTSYANTALDVLTQP